MNNKVIIILLLLILILISFFFINNNNENFNIIQFDKINDELYGELNAMAHIKGNLYVGYDDKDNLDFKNLQKLLEENPDVEQYKGIDLSNGNMFINSPDSDQLVNFNKLHLGKGPLDEGPLNEANIIKFDNNMSYLKKDGNITDEKPESIIKAVDELCIVKDGESPKCINGNHLQKLVGNNLTLKNTSNKKLTPFNIDYGKKGDNISIHNMNQKTIDGWKCQKWNTDYPNRHDFNWQGNHNYCRNPDGEPCDWCYKDYVKIAEDGSEVETSLGHFRWGCCADPDQGWGSKRIYNQTLVSFDDKYQSIKSNVTGKEACFGDGEKETIVVNVGSSGSQEKIVNIGQKSNEGHRVNPTPINTQNPRWRDRFEVQQLHDGQSRPQKQVKVRRVDVGHGWGQNLRLNSHPVCASNYGVGDKECPSEYPICIGYSHGHQYGSCHKITTHDAISTSKNIKIKPETAVIDKISHLHAH